MSMFFTAYRSKKHASFRCIFFLWPFLDGVRGFGYLSYLSDNGKVLE